MAQELLEETFDKLQKADKKNLELMLTIESLEEKLANIGHRDATAEITALKAERDSLSARCKELERKLAAQQGYLTKLVSAAGEREKQMNAASAQPQVSKVGADEPKGSVAEAVAKRGGLQNVGERRPGILGEAAMAIKLSGSSPHASAVVPIKQDTERAQSIEKPTKIQKTQPDSGKVTKPKKHSEPKIMKRPAHIDVTEAEWQNLKPTAQRRRAIQHMINSTTAGIPAKAPCNHCREKGLQCCFFKDYKKSERCGNCNYFQGRKREGFTRADHQDG